MDKYFKSNRKLWDDLTKIHIGSKFYDVDAFRKGKSTLPDVEIEEVGSVAGKSLLHLQCHFGQDTLCWARLGAKVTGVDFSQKSIDQANMLAGELELDAEFICSNLYELTGCLDKKYDIIYTSSGVLNWLPDMERWAETISHFLKPGGIFYIHEFHPVFFLFDDEQNTQTPTLRYPYFKSDKPLNLVYNRDYADSDAGIESASYEWFHGLGEIVTSLIEAGLRIEFLHEFNYCHHNLHPLLTQGDDGLWRYTGLDGGLPLMFSIRAEKKDI